jgi:cell division protein FtsB
MQVPNIRNKSNNKKGWSKAIILIIAWMLIFSLAKDLTQVRKGFTRIDEAKVRLAQEEAKNQMLKDKLETVMTEEYKEKIIREQLNMQKVGEVVAVLPKGNLMINKNGETEEIEAENWQKWWSLLK